MTNPAPAPARTPSDAALTNLLRNLKFARLDSGWWYLGAVRVRVGPGGHIGIFVAAPGRVWSARLEDAPTALVTQAISLALDAGALR